MKVTFDGPVIDTVSESSPGRNYTLLELQQLDLVGKPICVEHYRDEPVGSITKHYVSDGMLWIEATVDVPEDFAYRELGIHWMAKVIHTSTMIRHTRTVVEVSLVAKSRYDYAKVHTWTRIE